MTLKQIASLGKELAKFLALFACCFRSGPGFALFKVYVQGLLSNVQRKNVEAIALEFGKPPRTVRLVRLLRLLSFSFTRNCSLVSFLQKGPQEAFLRTSADRSIADLRRGSRIETGANERST